MNLNYLKSSKPKNKLIILQMTSHGYTSCSMELDPNINPVPSVVQDFPMFQHVGLIQESNGGDDKDSDIGIQKWM